MLYGCLISNISNAKIGPLFYFTPNVKSLYNRLQYLLRKLPTDEKGGQTHTILGFGKDLLVLLNKQGPKLFSRYYSILKHLKNICFDSAIIS